MHFTNKLVLSGALLVSQVSFAHGPKPMPLIDVPVPPVPGLTDGSDPIVTNKNIAVALGKALFWEMNVGSDGMACGSCHFNAGADRRVKNQLNPGDKGTLATAHSFETTASGADGGPNYTLTPSDFPFYQFNDPIHQASGVKFQTDDVGASSGTFSGQFKTASRFSGSNDTCSRSADPLFSVNHTGTRRVEPRNAPTMINAVFNHRNFWDGRANNVFNGSSNWGERDAEAGVWIKKNARSVVKQPLHLINSSLASQAVATVQSDTEMACVGRNLADVGRKLLSRQPLQTQQVHGEDSVFAPLQLVAGTQKGLNTTYKALVMAAFNPKYWSYSRVGEFGAPAAGGSAYNQMEANFSMFFGLALQLYEATLVSDQAPIDLSPRDPVTMEPTWEGMGYSAAEIATLKAGLQKFESNHCNLCHSGPLLTNAAIAANSALVTPTDGAFFGPEHFRIPFGPTAMGPAISPGAPYPAQEGGITPHGNVVGRQDIRTGTQLIDFGFANTGVADPNNDLGVGGNDSFGNPLSYAAQYKQYLLGNYDSVVDSVVYNQKVCDFRALFSYNDNFELPDIFTALDGLQVDGSREGQARNRDCISDPSLAAYIPTITAANANKDTAKMAVSSKAAFKVPTLRNVELTGPFMHNGSMATLEQVLEFYSRLGNNQNPDQDNFMPSIALNASNSAQSRAQIVAFLKTLTDERVRYKRAPFDHPEIAIPHGHQGDEVAVVAGNALGSAFAKDELLTIPATGANGLTEPLVPFEQHLPD
ncbi:cytochrome-c peroxidase [Methylomonas rhizoryzae]|uniref:cytochrome-c peroxidase n=1 Tax=Methylomonas rhizoryzae TaxID=2608981 RepID=UPI001232160F|nr:cytochrome c peroxidase [Methylomonas rhizoryzae]